MSFLDRIRACNRHDLTKFVPFTADGHRVGWVRRDRLDELARHKDVFRIDPTGLTLNSALDGFEARSDAMAMVAADLAARGQIRRVRGEDYAVGVRFDDPPLFRLDRGAVPYFGVRAYGVHMNGFVISPDGLQMWVPRRAADKAVAPGKLDNMVAGGQPIGLTVRENLIKECAEEASIDETLARQAVSVGAIIYCVEIPEGLKPDVHFCFDLEIPADFVPRSEDGEHAAFTLMPIDDVAALVRETDDFKFNCNLVIIDFLIRHGLLGPEDPDFLSIVSELRQ